MNRSASLLSRQWFWVIVFLVLGLLVTILSAFMGLFLGVIYLFGGFVLHKTTRNSQIKVIAQASMVAGGILIMLVLFFMFVAFISVDADNALP